MDNTMHSIIIAALMSFVLSVVILQNDGEQKRLIEVINNQQAYINQIKEGVNK